MFFSVIGMDFCEFKTSNLLPVMRNLKFVTRDLKFVTRDV